MKLKGFTLVELLIVISIMATLSAVGLVMYGNTQAKGRDSKRQQDLSQIQASLEAYQADNNYYPLGMVNLVPKYLDEIPDDPKNSGIYVYTYEKLPASCTNTGTSFCTGYNLTAGSEQNTGKIYYASSGSNVSLLASIPSPVSLSSPTAPPSSPAPPPPVPSTSPGPFSQDNGATCSANNECISGNCYIDEDTDRYAPSSGGTRKCQALVQLSGIDCYESSSDPKAREVYPGQSQYFTTPYNGTNWDYDCSGGITKRYEYACSTSCIGGYYSDSSCLNNSSVCTPRIAIDCGTYSSAMVTSEATPTYYRNSDTGECDSLGSYYSCSSGGITNSCK
jgi:prepilin-type N-terminal cleavage/methylation domain-containing protein